MGPAGMPPRARKGALTWIITLVFHAALIAICAVILVSAPTRSAREIGIDLSLQPSAGTGGAGEPDAATMMRASHSTSWPAALSRAGNAGSRQ